MPASSLSNFVRHYLLAVQFFTRLPITGRLAGWVGYSPEMLRASAAHFPGVGWLVAAVAMGVHTLLWTALAGSSGAALVAAVFSTAATVWLTGGLHEDGLADVADGLGGSLDRNRALQIMKDSHIGAFGSLALVLALLAKVALLALLGTHGLGFVLAALAGGHVSSRFWPLLLVRALPHIGDTAQSKSKPLAGQITAWALGAAFVWCFMPLALIGWAQGALFLIASSAASAITFITLWRWFARRLQGFTGDCLGATQQLCEIAFYLGAAVAVAQGLRA